ncbi:MAG TPA: type I methionyl aminopeptidase, partial [Terriglobia bacterium]|nr:type I methionyl aminopeptidase [Terriglobia bacterium]
MSIKSDREFQALRAIGRIVALVLRELAQQVKQGVTTAELDGLAAKFLAEYGATSAPAFVYGFPGSVCISVNDEIVHGIPGTRVVRPGDLVKLDLTAEKDGYMADAALTVPVPPVSDDAARLADCAERAFKRAMHSARAFRRIADIGMAVEQEVKRGGFSVVRALCGHGIGRTIHEEPQVPNYGDTRSRQRLTEGLVITVEPIIAAGSGEALLGEDGWTVKTADHRLAAHYEHTMVITRSEPVLLTLAQSLHCQTPPASGWLDEWGRLKGGYPFGLGVALKRASVLKVKTVHPIHPRPL